MKTIVLGPPRPLVRRVVALAMTLVVLGCEAAAPASTPAPTTSAAAATASTAPAGAVASPGASTRPAVTAAPAAADARTSEARIAEALAAGRIDYGTSLAYRAYAAFGSPLLPEDYRSPVVDLHAATFLFAEIAANEATLDPAVLTALEPYTARPNDPASIFNRAQGVAARGPLTAATSWLSRSAAGGRARVWVADGGGAQDRLAEYARVVDAVWPNVFSLVPEPVPDEAGEPLLDVNPDSAIDLYFADAGTVDPRIWACRTNPTGKGCADLAAQGGYTSPARPTKATTASAYVMIDTGVSGDLLTSHVAHELMHAAQFRFDYDESPWLLDSTATWGAYRTLQLLGVTPEPVYEYLAKFFGSLDERLPRDDELNRYGSWLYFLSLQIDAGDSVARTVFEKMAAPGRQGVAAVDQAYPFAEHFGRFAVRNWNDATADAYRQKDGTFPSSVKPPPDERGTLFEGETRLGFETASLSADYAVYEFPDEIGRVLFRNSLAGVIAECACVPSVWLIEKVDGVWKAPEQVIDDQRRWCRSRPGEHVEELVIVVANPDADGLMPLPAGLMPTLEASEASCGGEGTITYSRVKHGTYTSNRNNPVEVDMSDQATITFDITVDDYDIDRFVATTSSMTWSYSLTATEVANGCTIVESAEGGGTITGEGGPDVSMGLRSDGTLFGVTFDEKAYTVNVVPPTMEMADGDPRGHYKVSSSICGEIQLGGWWPYTGPIAIVSGDIPEDARVLTGTRRRTIPAQNVLDVPTVETVTWTINLD